MRPKLLLVLTLLTSTLAAEESCMERCENGFDATEKCQCDSMCTYYRSCCTDYETMCRITTRGDMFPAFPEDEENSTVVPPTPKTEAVNMIALLTPKPLTPLYSTVTTTPDTDAEVCSGRPFDSFMQLKNGSVYAFRGKYFFELNEKSVQPGYPKLIEDIWGIKGPIDAAFTRVNCQGKTYIFKGNQYWRFNNGVLEEDFPRDISVGFENIPDHLNAAFATAAHSHHGKEKAYFFKGDQYYQYEFKHQPSHEECIQMVKSSPSALFNRYTDIYYNIWSEHFSQLFSGVQSHHGGHHFINTDWIGIKSPVDAVLAGRLYVSPRHLQRPSRRRQHLKQQWGEQWGYQWSQQWDQQRGQQWNSRRRHNRSPSWEGNAEKSVRGGQQFARGFREDGWRGRDRRRNGNQQQYDYDYDYRLSENPAFDFLHRRQPLQSVYFFKGVQYYRVDLQTKRVDHAFPPYPRSIEKYWLGCPDSPTAEKR